MTGTARRAMLPKPLEHQRNVLSGSARFKMLICGRR
jgi:hypothetical protein